MRTVLPIICERVRSQVSMELDGELSQFERRLVSTHLDRCSDCRAFDESVREFTEELRATPLESPREPIVVRRSRRRISLTGGQISAAATLAVAVLGVATQLGLSQSHGPGVEARMGAATLFQTSWQPERELAQIDVAFRASRTNANDPGPLGAV